MKMTLIGRNLVGRWSCRIRLRKFRREILHYIITAQKGLVQPSHQHAFSCCLLLIDIKDSEDEVECFLAAITTREKLYQTAA